MEIIGVAIKCKWRCVILRMRMLVANKFNVKMKYLQFFWTSLRRNWNFSNKRHFLKFSTSFCEVTVSAGRRKSV